MQLFNEISKVYNERISNGMPSEQARIFTDDQFSNVDSELLKNLRSQGLIELWVTNGFSLTDYAIKQITN